MTKGFARGKCKRNRNIKIAALVVLILLSSLISGRYTEAAQTTALLKECLLTETMYKAEYIDSLNTVFRNDLKNFRDLYNGKAVYVTGRVMPGSLKDGSSEMLLYGSAGRIVVDISARGLQGFYGGLSDYDPVTAYGRIRMTGILGDSYVLEAEHLSVGREEFIQERQYAFYGDDAVCGEPADDMAADSHVVINIPEGWKDTYCMGRLTNNGINGYQFFLNAIEPRNLDYPEIFNIFYFNYLEYLEPTPKNPSKSARGYIEELIVKNILSGLDADFKLKSTSVKIENREYDYISTSYALNSGKTYNMEFMFLPDEKGLTCMLYMYYPREGTANHLHEVAYLIETIDN
ncbi:MAG: hypothetical protein K6G81_00090 [Lachnospiraceae bacterium]|nr:hypothetical protein [Lachnospiraceae bacterium]